MKTREEIELEVIEELETLKPLYMGVNGQAVEYTDADYDWHVQTRTDMLFNEQQFGWIAKRQEEYGSVQEQLDMQYWDSVNGTTTWQDHIAQVKLNNPKP